MESINAIVQSRDQILKVFPLSGPSFTGMLIGVNGPSLLFEKRDGMRILIHRDEIAYAAEVVPRGL
jgi:hypothetical protein